MQIDDTIMQKSSARLALSIKIFYQFNPRFLMEEFFICKVDEPEEKNKITKWLGKQRVRS